MVALILEILEGPIVSGLFGVLIGAWLGNHFALGQDKRKEHNLVMKPILLALLKHEDDLSKEDKNSWSSFLLPSIESVRLQVSKRKFIKLQKLHDEYLNLSRSGIERDAYTGLVKIEEGLKEKLETIIKKMLSVIKKK